MRINSRFGISASVASLGALAAALVAAPQDARAQSVEAQGITFLAPPDEPDAANSIFPDSHVFPTGITADGTTVVAIVLSPSASPNFDIQSQNSEYFHIWTNGVLQTIAINNAVPPEGRGRGFGPLAISGDGTTIVGQRAAFIDRENGAASFTRAAIWTQADGVSYFPDLSPTEIASPEVSVNADGSVFAATIRNHPYNPDGSTNPARNAPRRAYRYSVADGFQNLGSLGATVNMAVSGIDGQGNVISGNAYDTAFNNFDIDDDVISQSGFRWSAAAGLIRLPDLAAAPLGGTLASFSATRGVSRDGSTIVGYSRGSDGRDQAVYWRGDTVTGLGFVPGLNTQSAFTIANAASADGSVIVGTATTTSGEYFRAWHWTLDTGMQDLNTLAQNAGLNLNGFVLSEASGISDNGQYISGSANKGPLDELGFSEQIHGYVLSFATVAMPENTTSTARLIVRLTLPGVTQESIVTQSFATQIDGRLNGAVVATRNVAASFTSAAGNTALNEVRGLLQQTNGLRRITIGAPVLVSSTTSVLSSTSTTTNVASGTAVTTAVVTTTGPGTVATGDLGTCTTAAATNVNPTGCTLPGTPLAVVSGSTNTNTFTNTINSITPTTRTEVSQLVSARWQVSATAGNQFGTVHALAGVAAFDRGNRLIAQLLDQGGEPGAGTTQLTRAAVPVGGAQGLAGDSPISLFGGAFGSWSSIDADTAVPVADVRGDTTGVVLGLAARLGEQAEIGVAIDYGTSDMRVRDPLFAETLNYDATQIAAFANWSSGGLSLSGAAAYGFGDARTLIATPTTPAAGQRDVDSWSAGAATQYRAALSGSFAITPQVGVRHVSAKLAAFSESGGPGPLAGGEQTVERTRIYAGLEAEAGFAVAGARITPRIYARAARDSGDASGTADLLFAASPSGPLMTASGPGVGRDVAELGGSLDVALGAAARLQIGYDAVLRDGARSHAASVGLNMHF